MELKKLHSKSEEERDNVNVEMQSKRNRQEENRKKRVSIISESKKAKIFTYWQKLNAFDRIK